MSMWLPIETAPKNNTMILLAYILDGEIRTVDYGCWEFIENSDWDGAAVFGWMTVNDQDRDWSHWALAPSEQFVVRLDDNGNEDTDEAYEQRTEARKTTDEIIFE
jgi:hypothetical protein